MPKVMVGDQAPDFTLPDQERRPVCLWELVGKKAIVLYFYPKDNTPGCTLEARMFRDQYEVFSGAGAEVIGVSGDTVASHARFVRQHNLPFLLLSDRRGEVRELYGVERTLGLVPGRVTYVIDKEGIVRHVFSSQLDVKRHVQEALETVRSLVRSGER